MNADRRRWDRAERCGRLATLQAGHGTERTRTSLDRMNGIGQERRRRRGAARGVGCREPAPDRANGGGSELHPTPYTLKEGLMADAAFPRSLNGDPVVGYV